MKIIRFFPILFLGGLGALAAPSATNAPANVPPSAPGFPKIVGVNPPANVPPGGMAAQDPHRILPAEWQRLNAARQAAMQANPQLMVESLQLVQKMRAFQDKLGAAMIQTDPNIAPILAKLSPPRPATTAPLTRPPGPVPPPPPMPAH